MKTNAQYQYMEERLKSVLSFLMGEYWIESGHPKRLFFRFDPTKLEAEFSKPFNRKEIINQQLF